MKWKSLLGSHFQLQLKYDENQRIKLLTKIIKRKWRWLRLKPKKLPRLVADWLMYRFLIRKMLNFNPRIGETQKWNKLIHAKCWVVFSCICVWIHSIKRNLIPTARRNITYPFSKEHAENSYKLDKTLNANIEI